MFQGWRPPGASTAIRPSRVVGWPAPIATLVNLLKKCSRLVAFLTRLLFDSRTLDSLYGSYIRASQKGK